MSVRLKKKIAMFGCVFFALSSSPVFSEITNEDWKNYLKRSCEPTLTGKSKRFFDELSFWAHVNTSMDAWLEWFRSDKPVEWCRIEFQGPKNHERMMQCYYSYKEQVEWMQRCKPLVVQLCRKAGGYCS